MFYSLHGLEPKGYSELLLGETAASRVGLAGEWENRSQRLGAYEVLAGLAATFVCTFERWVRISISNHLTGLTPTSPSSRFLSRFSE